MSTMEEREQIVREAKEEEAKAMSLQLFSQLQEERQAHTLTSLQLSSALEEIHLLKQRLSKEHQGSFSSLVEPLRKTQEAEEEHASLLAKMEGFQKEKEAWEEERRAHEEERKRWERDRKEWEAWKKAFSKESFQALERPEILTPEDKEEGAEREGKGGMVSRGSFPELSLAFTASPAPSTPGSSMPSPTARDRPAVMLSLDLLQALSRHLEELRLQLEEQEARLEDSESFAYQSHAARSIKFAGILLKERRLASKINELEIEEYELKTRVISISNFLIPPFPHSVTY